MGGCSGETQMTIARVIERRSGEIITCPASTSVRDAVAVLAEKRIGALPVFDGERVVGMFSERDVIYQLKTNGPAILDLSVGEIMTAPAITVARETTILQALSLMTRRRVRHLPVVENGRMVSLVSIGDLVKFRLEQYESEVEQMRNYIQSA